MNRNTIIGGVIVIILVVLSVWYYSSSNVVSTSVTTKVDDSLATTKTATANPSTFRSIFAQDGNHQCSYEQISQSGRSSSVVYIADGKMRGEFRTTTGDSFSGNLMIYNGGYLYSWKEGATVGKRSSIKSIAELPNVIPNDLTSGAVFGTNTDNVSWDCHDWLKDDKMFVLPKNMTFSAS